MGPLWSEVENLQVRARRRKVDGGPSLRAQWVDSEQPDDGDDKDARIFSAREGTLESTVM